MKLFLRYAALYLLVSYGNGAVIEVKNKPEVVVQLNPGFFSNPFFQRIFARNLPSVVDKREASDSIIFQVEPLNEQPEGAREFPGKTVEFQLPNILDQPRPPMNISKFPDVCKHKVPWGMETSLAPLRGTTEQDETAITTTCGPTKPDEPHRFKWCKEDLKNVGKPSVPPIGPCNPTAVRTTDFSPCDTFVPPTRPSVPCPTTEPCVCATLPPSTCPTTTCPTPTCRTRIARHPRYFLMLKGGPGAKRRRFIEIPEDQLMI